MTEEEFIANIPAVLIRENAHRIYDFMSDHGLPSDSVIREELFAKAESELGVHYDVFYYAWLRTTPIS